jgi:RNA:NAD 2'-phosphotransferase (TPT1/KptA family)
MRAKEFIEKFKSWKKERETAPVPPPHNLFHATFKDNLPSITKQGLLRSGVEKLYKDSEPGVVYLTTSPEIASSMLDKQSSMIDKELLSKMSEEGVMLEIDVSKLDPSKFREDELVPASWVNPRYTYKYQGDVPPDAIKVRNIFSVDLDPYYRRHEMRSIKPSSR